MDSENTATTEVANKKKQPKGFKRKEAFRITQKNWDTEKNTIDMKSTIDEIAAAIEVGFAGAKSYFSYFAKEQNPNFKIPGLKGFWENDLKGTRINGTKKSGETKDAGDGGTKAETMTKPKTEKKTGGSADTLAKMKDVLKNSKVKKSTDKLAAALAAAHPEKSITPAPVGEQEKIAA